MDEVAGPIEGAIREESTVPWCALEELEASVTWAMTDQGGLGGHLTLRNVGTRTCRVGGKPEITPLDVNGEPLPTKHIVSLELRVPSWAAIGPRETAAARVWWSG